MNPLETPRLYEVRFGQREVATQDGMFNVVWVLDSAPEIRGVARSYRLARKLCLLALAETDDAVFMRVAGHLPVYPKCERCNGAGWLGGVGFEESHSECPSCGGWGETGRPRK